MMEIRQKQELEGYKPGMFIKSRKTDSFDGIRMTAEDIRLWRWKQTTDGINRKDFIRDVKAEEDDKKQLEAKQAFTAPIDIADMYTEMLMPAIPKSLEPGTTDKMISQILTPQVDVQEQEPQELIEEPDEDELTQRRPAVLHPKPKDAEEIEEDEDLYYKISKSSLDTVPLVNNIIDLYNRDHGKYPDAVIIEPLRYMALGIKHRLACQCGGKSIPIFCADGSAKQDFEVMARGRRNDESWIQ